MNQSNPRSKSAFFGLAAGVGFTALAAVMMGQGASQPVKSEPQYFVTADGELFWGNDRLEQALDWATQKST